MGSFIGLVLNWGCSNTSEDPGDIFGCHDWQECWQIPYKAQDRPRSVDLSSPNVNRQTLLVTHSRAWGCTNGVQGHGR